MRVVYEDNHIIVVYKESGEIVQGDKTGDVPLSDIVKGYIKEKYQKPGNVFLGVVHRLDRPVYGLVLFARTSKALPRLNKMFQNKEGEEGVRKTYWAIVPKAEEKKSKNAEFLLMVSHDLPTGCQGTKSKTKATPMTTRGMTRRKPFSTIKSLAVPTDTSWWRYDCLQDATTKSDASLRK